MPHPALSNPYGYHDEISGEYVITRPDTPTPWINYLGEGRYGGIISNTAGGFSFDRDPKNRRVTRYRYNSIPVDQPGRYIYLRDQASGAFWSPTWQPVIEQTLDSYECRHGPGYTRITSVFQGIQAEILYFVPPTAPQDPCPLEIWRLRLKNLSNQKRTLRSFSYAELSFLNAEADLHNLDWGQHILSTRQQGGVLFSGTRFQPTTTFSASSRAPLGFDSDREVFVGRCRGLNHPQVVAEGQPRNSLAARGNNITSLCHEWALASGETQELVYFLGVTDTPNAIPATLAGYQKPEAVEEAFRALQLDWRSYLDHFQVETPDVQMNTMINVWNAVQCRTTLFWSRFVSAYETGLGRGMGTRDSAQDTLGTVHAAPRRARQNLSMLWRLQFQDGHTWHQVYPLTGEGGAGLAAESPDWPQWFSDDPLWLALGVCAYLRETGDFAYLQEVIPYQDGGEDTVWNHIQRAVDFTLNHRGPHGLPRLGFSDWDDSMNLDHGSGKAESVWTGQQFCRVMLDLAELCDVLDETAEAERFRGLFEMMKQVINQNAWDGAWYARAYDDEGLPVGVETETYHKINLMTQTWAVIGEVADNERAYKAMESAHNKLNSYWGLALLDPPYESGNMRVNGTSTYPPGAKENGGIFCHANTWAIIAAARLGWAERAYQYYLQLIPFSRADVADLYAAEPYVFCANICGPTHPQFGYGRNSWLSGTASWMYVAVTQWILGIRPTYWGLEVQPLLPPGWPGFNARRIYRGVTYRIEVVRTGAGNEATLIVEGQPQVGTIIPLAPDSVKQVHVRVEIH